MALEVKKVKRVFLLKKGKSDTAIELADPNPKMSPEEVLDHYSGEYPELTNSTIAPGEIKEGRMEFQINSSFGPKG